MLEREVFKRRTILFDKLEKFGFIRKNDCFVFEQKIYEGMIAKVTIFLNGEVCGEVYDEDFKEPYVNYRVESATGAFVVGVRNAYLALLDSFIVLFREFIRAIYEIDDDESLSEIGANR